MRTGEAELVRDAERFGLRSMLCVPLITGARTLGTITLLASEHTYGAAELELASEIARRTAAAIEIERSEERYRMLFEASPMPMWVYDADTLAFVRVNDAAIRKYGYSREEFLKMRITDIRPPEDIPAMLADVKARGGPGSTAPKIWRHLTKDGSLIEVEVTAGRITFEGRRAALVLANDVSERMRLERRLADAEKMEAIGRLAGGVAHDFNNLLTVIAGYAEILQTRAGGERGGGGDRPRRGARRPRSRTSCWPSAAARSCTRRCSTSTRSSRAWRRCCTGSSATTSASARGWRADLAPVEADRAQIERVILNLAANARDAMPGGGALTIETANVDVDEAQVAEHGDGRAGPHVLLAVSDTGHGMDADVTKHLFEPFFTTKAAGAGTGLGLATVFGVVKQSGGGIYVYSEPGRGSTFKIYLPAASTGAEAAEQAPEPEAARGTETIMVVEDDDGVRALVQLMLEANGYVVHAVARRRRGRADVHRAAVDLLLTDVVMPHVSGLAARGAPERARAGHAILFMSGYSDEAVQRHGEITASAAFLEKPFTERALARKVREVLDA